MYKVWLSAICILHAVWAQGQVSHADSISHAIGPHNAQNLADFMRRGEFTFHTRSFAMSTINRGELLDYSTLAFGGGIGYYSPEFRGFHFGLSGFFAFQVFEHNIRIADPTTGNVNRYEILLYDMSDLENTSDFDRLEDIYIAYRLKGFDAILGRQRVSTPLLNEQDNRMRPNHFSGLSLRYREKRWDAFLGLYGHVTMRGTVNWYSIDESFGVYPFGRNQLGTPSGYRDNIDSKGLAVLGLAYEVPEQLKVQTWNYTAENVFNLSMVQADGSVAIAGTNLLYGVQAMYQLALNEGGNAGLEKTYMVPGSEGRLFGARIGVGSKERNVSINAMRISSKGRFLFPREWGREQLYVSLPRERHEGNGDVTAFTAKYEGRFNSASLMGLSGMLGAGVVHNPSVDHFALNKYGVPSYYHFVGNLKYAFHGYLKGMDVMVLVAQKTAINPGDVPDAFRINRVDLWNFNAVVNYHF